MLDIMTKQQLIDEGVLKESGWKLFKKWKKDFLKRNSEVKKISCSIKRKAIYQKALQDEGIPVRIIEYFTAWFCNLKTKATFRLLFVFLKLFI